jgi:hypothetical protein
MEPTKRGERNPGCVIRQNAVVVRQKKFSYMPGLRRMTSIVFLTLLTCASAASQESVLYAFSGPDGAEPYAGALVFDKAGNLYGTTFAGGLPEVVRSLNLVRLVVAVGRSKYFTAFRTMGATGSIPMRALSLIRRVIFTVQPQPAEPDAQASAAGRCSRSALRAESGQRPSCIVFKEEPTARVPMPDWSLIGQEISMAPRLPAAIALDTPMGQSFS